MTTDETPAVDGMIALTLARRAAELHDPDGLAVPRLQIARRELRFADPESRVAINRAYQYARDLVFVHRGVLSAVIAELEQQQAAPQPTKQEEHHEHARP